MSESATMQTVLGQAVDKIARGQDSLHMNVQVIQDNICEQILRSGDTSVRDLGMIRGDIRRTSLIQRRNQLGVNRQLRKLNQGRSQLNSMLTQLSSLHLESQRADAPDVAHYSGLENMAFLLVQMRDSVNQMISDLQSDPLLKVSDGEVKFFLEEFERLVTFCSERGAVRNPYLAISDDDQGFKPKNSAAKTASYSLGTDIRSLPKTTQRSYQRRKLHCSSLGRLEIQFEEIIGDSDDLPTTVQRASLRFMPDGDTHSTGIYASFRKDLRMAQSPCITRSLREVRVVQWDAEIQLHQALVKDDLPALQRMLSTGQIKPWDMFFQGNLIEVRCQSLR